MKNLSKYLWVVFFLAALYFVIPDKYTRFIGRLLPWSNHDVIVVDDENDAALQDSVNSMKERIQLYEQQQLEYSRKISSYEDSLYELNQKIANNNIKIQELKKANHEKANNVTKFSSDELYKFLSERYKDSIK